MKVLLQDPRFDPHIRNSNNVTGLRILCFHRLTVAIRVITALEFAEGRASLRATNLDAHEMHHWLQRHWPKPSLA
jgi:hypothetical protein